MLVGGYYLWKCCHAPHPKPPPGTGNGVPVVPPMVPPPSNKNMSEIPGHGSPTIQPPPSYSPNNMPYNPDYPGPQGPSGQPFPPGQPLQSIPPEQPGYPTSAGYPGHPSSTSPPNHPPQQDHYPDQNDHSPDIDSGSEYEDVPDQDNDSSQDPNEPHDPNQDPHDPHHKKPYRRIQRVRIYGNNHHHHLAYDHPCYTTKCPIASSDHRCDDANHPCTCVDPKCKLNSRLHMCSGDKAEIHRCPGPKHSKNCPLMDPPYAEKKKKEHAELVRKYMAQDFAKSGVKSAATYGIRTLAM
ncbi:hypothetical protein BCR34DRAFT_570268 [Clohesyomyces aquaticus]|uniref:Uncharacterized protein n=1 Tax=Clohesyomyces aquaticus TaxID=1231657 RepID=A0A1Y1ZDM7_9PLEO|nr:hypothetical protein BCR34DRAFT_570268 [Clohesyomyces aquaticus]